MLITTSVCAFNVTSDLCVFESEYESKTNAKIKCPACSNTLDTGKQSNVHWHQSKKTKWNH